MLSNRRFTAVLSIAALALIGGCSTSGTPTSTERTNQTDDLNTSNHAVESVTKVESSKSIEPNNNLSLVPASNPDPAVNGQIQDYLKALSAKGFNKTSQGVWMQSGNTLLAQHQGTIPLPAASLTKVATTLVALQTLGPDRQFITKIGMTGAIENGVLKGDLVVEGGEDPLFVWEEAIGLGNTLNQMGINKVTGNLIIVGKFYMNFKTSPVISGNFLKQGLNSKIWSKEAEKGYLNLPSGTPKPQVEIAGTVKVMGTTPSNLQLLINHYSLPLAELLKRMNRFSNNYMAEMIADTVGGAKIVAKKAAESAGIPESEIKLVNGSGLSIDNRISPRGVCAMFLAIERYLAPYKMSIGDVFAIIGRDEGTLDKRNLPALIIVKSGTLDNVSTLAGLFPTQQQGNVWFAIMNGGKDTDELRIQQEDLIKSFLQNWGEVSSLPTELNPNPELQTKTSRNEVVK